MGTITGNYNEITVFLARHYTIRIFLVFFFFYLNSSYKLELSLVCTLILLGTLHMVQLGVKLFSRKKNV
jgi:hypothetical protein